MAYFASSYLWILIKDSGSGVGNSGGDSRPEARAELYTDVNTTNMRIESTKPIGILSNAREFHPARGCSSQLSSMQSLRLFAALVGIIHFLTPASGAMHTSPKATTLNGTYVGIHNPQYSVDFFLGIPYALPPVKSLRYRQPQPLNTSWVSERNATAFGNQCVGYGVSSSYIFRTS
jgi:Carboxylesterase family